MKIKKGRKIYLSITMMVPPQVEMPNLLDLSLRQAMNMLEANNLELGQVIYKPSKYPNAVLEQRYKGKIIQEGRKIPYQAKITLVVGKEVGADTPLEDVEISD
jgi:beta-lactam-binding protein with PASTA domain